MKKRLRESRPIAPWGALISGLGTVLGMMSSNSAAKRQEEQLRREQRLQQLSLEKTNLDNTAQSINNYINTITNEPEYIPYATSGAIRRRKYDKDNLYLGTL